MKILWLAHEGNISGANLCLLEYLYILQRTGIENHLIVPSVKGMAKASTEINIPFSEIKFYSWTAPYPDFKFPVMFRIKKWLRNRIAVHEIVALITAFNPDFVVTNTIVTPVGAWAAKKEGKKHVWFIHEFGEEDHGFSILGGFRKGAAIMNFLSYKMVFNSEVVKEKYKMVPENKKKIVRYAIPILCNKSIHPLNDSFYIIILGQIAPSKNHWEALKALQICKKRGLEVRLNIVGKAENHAFLKKLERYVEEFGLNKQVKFIGPLLDPTNYLQQHHVLIMCSKMEAFGRVTVEALKLGVPVIAANTGGSLEILENGFDGYFYEGGNEKDLADKIMLLHEEYQHFDRSKIVEKAREKFNEVNTYKQLLDVFC